MLSDLNLRWTKISECKFSDIATQIFVEWITVPYHSGVNLITKTRLYNFDPLKPHVYIVKLGFTGVYMIFLISVQKHRLWVLVRTALSTHNVCFEQICEKYQNFYTKTFRFWC